MTLRVCVAGATGWAGSALSRGIAATADLTLVSAISRTHAGKKLGEALDHPHLDCPVFASAEEALRIPCDVFVEYTKPTSALDNILRALAAGAHVVVGTSGLTNDEYATINAAALAADRGVLAVGNFALTVVLLQHFASLAARYIPHWEIIDYAHERKIDAPSGTARELANRLGGVREAALDVPLGQTVGEVTARGARLSGQQVHSVRLPGHVLGVETIFGLPDEKLILRHEAGAGAQPYVGGALLAIRKVNTLRGLKRGLDQVMELS